MISSIGSSYSACSSYTAGVQRAASTTAVSASSSDGDNPLKAMFQSIDGDGNGSLTADELSTALAGLQDQAGTDIDPEKLLALLDADGGGTVTENELAAALAPPPPPQGGADGSGLLSSLDTDGNGSIDSNELTTAAGGADSTDLFSSLDADGNGQIDSDELDSALQASAPPPPPPGPKPDEAQGDAASDAFRFLSQVAGQYQAVSSYGEVTDSAAAFSAAA